ncbi:MAG: hypothetical protein ACXAD7_22605 [Candidatus Kariarchaeaceae archaeon]
MVNDILPLSLHDSDLVSLLKRILDAHDARIAFKLMVQELLAQHQDVLGCRSEVRI